VIIDSERDGEESGRIGPARHERNLVALIDVISQRDRVDAELVRRLQSVREYVVGAPQQSERFFLTVLLRTQGRRIEPLKDALLCLQGQSSQDFEVVVLIHNALPEDAADVRMVVDRQPPSLRDRIRIEEVRGGSRAKPLNVGVEMATGHYLAVFDDDDLLFGHWVETFAREAASNDGRLIRAVVANQSVEPELWPGDEDGFRTLTWPNSEYPEQFNQLAHLLVNYSPFMSWAFPRELFFLFGVRFDEELTVCEDWDVILRGSMLCGVDDVPELTAIYRRWQGAESSYSVHSSAEWQASERRVLDRIDSSVIMMPPGTMRSAREVLVAADILHSHRYLFKGNQLRWPLGPGWRMATPAVKIAVRVRNRVRRFRAARES
jgi:hypothetical protein